MDFKTFLFYSFEFDTVIERQGNYYVGQTIDANYGNIKIGELFCIGTLYE